MDAQGGEKIEAIAELFRELAAAFRARHPGRPDFYHLSEQVLCKFKMFQGYDPFHPISGAPIEQARWIWHGSPQGIIEALVRANMKAPA
jgi:hypothetical protein